jgi:hypothetical protein
VALLLFRISPIFCIAAEIDGCFDGKEKGDFLWGYDKVLEDDEDFLWGYDKVLEDDEATLAPSLTENDAPKELVPML